MELNDFAFPSNLMIFHLGLSLLIMVSCVRVLGADRPLFWREAGRGIHVGAFFFGRVTVNSIDLILQTVLYVSVYFLVSGPVHPTVHFFDYFWPCLALAFTSSSWGYFISAVVPPENATMGAVMFALVACGILGNPQNIGSFVGTLPMDIVTSVSITRWTVQMTLIQTIQRADEMNIEMRSNVQKLEQDYEKSILDLHGYETSMEMLLAEAVILLILGYFFLKCTNRSKQV